MLLSARALPDGRATDTATNAGSRAISSAAHQQRGPSAARPVSSAARQQRDRKGARYATYKPRAPS